MKTKLTPGEFIFHNDLATLQPKNLSGLKSPAAKWISANSHYLLIGASAIFVLRFAIEALTYYFLHHI